VEARLLADESESKAVCAMKTRLTEKSSSRRCTPLYQPSLKSGEGVKLEKSITIMRPREEIYAFWRRFENLPLFLSHLESVTQAGPCTSHWVMRTTRGKRLAWDAQIIEEKPNEMISWQSLPDSDVDNAGSVWFTPTSDGRGTVVKVSMKYSPPGGKVVAALAKVLGGDGEKNLEEDLVRFKALLESGR
jgi:uncharacterized membrane protein